MVKLSACYNFNSKKGRLWQEFKGKEVPYIHQWSVGEGLCVSSWLPLLIISQPIPLFWPTLRVSCPGGVVITSITYHQRNVSMDAVVGSQPVVYFPLAIALALIHLRGHVLHLVLLP